MRTERKDTAASQVAENFLQENLQQAAEDGLLAGIDDELVGTLRDRGITTVGDLFWLGEGWFASPTRLWITEAEREIILGAMSIIRDKLECYAINIEGFLFRLKVSAEFTPATNDPAGEPRFVEPNRDVDALPYLWYLDDRY